MLESQSCANPVAAELPAKSSLLQFSQVGVSIAFCVRLRQVKAFTLIESLVFIAIIGILATLALLGVRKAINRAEGARDASNLKQIFTAINLYANDHNNFYIVTAGGMLPGKERWFWYGIPYQPGQVATLRSPLMHYMGASDVRQMNLMTIAKANQTPTQQAATSGAYGFPYTVNYNLMPNTIGYSPVSRSAVDRPSKKILMLDSSTNTWGAGFFYNAGLNRIGADSEGMTRVLWADGHVTKEKRQHILDNAAEFISLDK